MQKINERPVCHRAEDLVTYLYGEATTNEARDFAAHMQLCDACRAEFTVFNQVHNSIVAWRNEAIGSVVLPEGQASGSATPVLVSTGFVQHERKLSAWAAAREFFTVSPVWLRGATAFAGLLLCALILFAVTRVWQDPDPVANTVAQPKASQEEFNRAVQREVDERLAKIQRENSPDELNPIAQPTEQEKPRNQFATRRTKGKTQPANRLTHEEREQLAADLGLIPGREEEFPFVLPDEPNQ